MGNVLQFKKATKKQAKLRLAIAGPSGSGKTFTALKLASEMRHPDGRKMRTAVIDTERGSASKYSDKFDFDVLEPDSFSPDKYVDCIDAAEAEGYEVLIIDSLSHAWMGKDGALEQVDKAKAKSNSGGNSFTAWRDVTPMHNRLVDAMLGSKMHVIATMRAKTEYVIVENEKGKKEPRKIGMAPIQRDGMEYEFDAFCDMDLDHNLIVGKTRCDTIDGRVFQKPGEELAVILINWLTDGAPQPPSVSEEYLGKFNAATAPADIKRITDELVKVNISDREREKIMSIRRAAIERIEATRVRDTTPAPAPTGSDTERPPADSAPRSERPSDPPASDQDIAPAWVDEVLNEIAFADSKADLSEIKGKIAKEHKGEITPALRARLADAINGASKQFANGAAAP